jgi:hypothetical protein
MIIAGEENTNLTSLLRQGEFGDARNRFMLNANIKNVTDSMDFTNLIKDKGDYEIRGAFYLKNGRNVSFLVSMEESALGEISIRKARPNNG